MTARNSPAEISGLARKTLSRPDLFPEEFISWLRRFISDNKLIVSSAAAVTTGTTKGITANWGGVLGNGTFTGTTERIPERAGASANFTLTKAYVRLETAAVTDTVFVIEKMTPDADSSWSTAATVVTLTVAAGHYETSSTISVAVTTGDLLRFRVTTNGASGSNYHIEVTGT